jgi:hypothetical protein
MKPINVYEIRPRQDHRGVDLISNALHSVGCGTTNQTQSALVVKTASLAAIE